MLTKHIMTLHNYNRMQYCQHKVHWQSSEMQAESQTGGPPPFVACSVTVTEGVKKDTYGRCQCRSAQADRQEASACTSSPALTEPGERAALVVGQPHTCTASMRLLMRSNMPAKSHYSRDGVCGTRPSGWTARAYQKIFLITPACDVDLYSQKRIST